MRVYTIHFDPIEANRVYAEPYIELSLFRLLDDRAIPTVRIRARYRELNIPVFGVNVDREVIHHAEPATTETGWPALQVVQDFSGSQSGAAGTAGTGDEPVESGSAIILVRTDEIVRVQATSGGRWRDLVWDAISLQPTSATDMLLVIEPGEYLLSAERRHNGLVVRWDGNHLRLSSVLERAIFGSGCSSVEV